MFMDDMLFESNVNYDLGKTLISLDRDTCLFESNVNYDLGKTIRGLYMVDFPV